jgi:predicted nucleic acid-binding protein
VILVDTSAWVEYLRATGSATNASLRRLIAEEADLVVTDVVVMEVLAGAPTERRVVELRRLLNRFDLLPVQGLADFEAAAALYRRCRRGGETVRKLTDCLVAAVAMRTGASLLHCDRDFDAIARHAPVVIAS